MPAGAIPTFDEFLQAGPQAKPVQSQPIPRFDDFVKAAPVDDDDSDTITPEEANAFKGDPYDGIKTVKPAPPPVATAYTGPKNLGGILLRTPPSLTHGGTPFGPNDIPAKRPMPPPAQALKQAGTGALELLNAHPRVSTPAKVALPAEAAGAPLDPEQTQRLQVESQKQAGAVTGATNTALAQVTPGNAAAAIATAGLAPIAQKVVALGFGSHMLRSAYQSIPEVKAAIDSGDTEKATEAVTGFIATLVMGGAAIGHVAGAAMGSKPNMGSAKDFGLQEGNAEPAPARPGMPPRISGPDYLRSVAGPDLAPPAQESARVFEQAGPSQEETYRQLFDQAEAAEQKRNARAARQRPTIPETGVPQRVTEVTDARERLAQKLTGQSWGTISAGDRSVIDNLINEGHGLSMEPGETRPSPSMPVPFEQEPAPAPKPEPRTRLSGQALRDKIHDVAAMRGSFGMSLLRKETGAAYAEIEPILDELVQNKTLAEARNRRGKVYHLSPEAVQPQAETPLPSAGAPGNASPEQAALAEKNTTIPTNSTLAENVGNVGIQPETAAEPPEPEKPKFSSTQVNMPEDVAQSHKGFARSIPDAELAEDGRELEPHITAKYGLHADDSAAVERVLRGMGPIKAKIGKLSVFSNPEGDVLKLDIDSPDLHAANAKIAQLPHTDSHPDYQPHMTVAYLKPGEGAKYVGREVPGLTGKEVTFNSLDFSDKAHAKTTIPLRSGQIEGPTGRDATVYTPTQRRLETTYRVVPADSLRMSFDEGYPQELQPRNTDRAGSRQRIEALKGELNPEQMGEAVNAGDGAPIVTQGGDVVTRNHGTQSIRELYDQNLPKAEEYRKWVNDNAARFGMKPEEVQGIKNPVLIRELKEDSSPADLVGFAEEANMPTVAKMSDAEQAQMLARRITGSVMDAFDPREDGSPNPEFTQAIMKGLPPQEQAAFMDKNGQLSQGGIRQLRNAVFAKAYPDTSAIERMAESTDDGVKNISNGMLLAAPKVARLQEAISRGDRHPLGVEKEIAQAASVLEDLKTRGMTVQQWMAQADMFGRDPVVENLVKILDEHKRSAARIGEVLKEYTDLVDQLGDPKQEGLFGAPQVPNESELLTAANDLVKERRAAEEASRKSGDLFADTRESEGTAGSGGVAEAAGTPEASEAGEPESPVAPPPKPPRARRKYQRGSFSNKAITSPSYDQTRQNFIDSLGLEGQEKAQFDKTVKEWEAKNPERKVVSFQDVRDEAKKYGPDVVSQLTRPRAGATLDPAVRQAARDALAGIESKITELSQQFAKLPEVTDPAEKLQLAGKIDNLRSQANNLVDVLIPTRSQDGRNLVYWRMAAQKSFDPVYWLSRATKEAGGILPDATRGKLQEILDRGRAAETEHGAESKQAQDVKRDLAQEMMRVQQSTPWETITALRKMGLMGVKTHLRNILGNTGFQLLEEAQRFPASIIDAGLSLATGQRTVQGINSKAFAKATYEAATRGAREFAETLKHGTPLDQLGKSELHRELNSGSKLVDAWVNYNSRLLSAEDRLFKVYAFERSLQEQMKLTGIKEPTETMRTRAVADAEYATFNNRNNLATGWNSMIAQFNKGGTSGKALALAAETAVPFVRTPTNILARLIDYSGGGVVRAGHAAVKSLIDGEFTAEQQRAISNGIGRSATGAALIYMGYKLAAAGKMTGTAQYDQGARNADEAAGRVPGAVLVDGEWRQINQLSPEGNLIAIGATLYRESSRGLKNELKRPQNILKIGTDTVMQQPMLEGTNQLIESLQQPGKKLDNFLASTAGSFVPTVVSEAAAAGDTKRRDIHAEGLWDSIKKAAQVRTPGMRNQLAPRKDAFGKEEPQDRIAAIDPFVGSKAKELNDPVLKEIVERGVNLSKITAAKQKSIETIKGREVPKGFDESQEELNLRNDIQGALVYRALSRVVKAPGYKKLPTDRNDDSRKDALEQYASETKRELNLGELTNSPGWAKLSKEQRIERLKKIYNRVR